MIPVYDPDEAALADALAAITQGRATINALRAELAALQERYADRDNDLTYEYTERMAAEARCEAWYLVAQYAEHSGGCPGNPCRCGLAGLADQVARVAPVATPHARIVALGRAALDYERLRPRADGGAIELPTEERAARLLDAREAYQAALRDAMGEQG